MPKDPEIFGKFSTSAGRNVNVRHVQKSHPFCNCNGLIKLFWSKERSSVAKKPIRNKSFRMFENIIVHKDRKVQVGKDQEKAQSERDSHSKNRGGKKTN